jgi:cell division protein ZapA (FtsZ GTPase activity inhibitor)
MPDEILDIQLEIIPKGRRFPVKINANDEELVREAAKQLRQKFTAYKQAYSEAGLSDKDLMTMVAIDIAVSHLQLERNSDKTPFVSRIQQLNEKLKDYLKEQ